jgi:hypothetical protein
VELDEARIMGGLYGDGIIACPGAFTAEWADRMAADIWRVWERVHDKPGGALPRGPQRFYVEVAPEDISGFVDIVTYPWFVAVCEAVLTRDYRIVEVGFDIPFPGAEDQPWHRDFRAPQATLEGRRLNSLAFNLTAIDTRARAWSVRGSRRERNGTGSRARWTACSPIARCGGGTEEARGAEDAAARRHVGKVGADHPPRARPTARPIRGPCWWSGSMRPTQPTPRTTTCR